ncbi:uncharacterized protein C20orf204 homolog isoform X1 [Monodelphis domestica]|uniref:uncharacterized protein C20orf204 homolog isoform X1 n=1 Tax=Monodelphis domestica TaxID=13616 RepID=UPI0024E1E195|nr:uncharacterized protein C20orf204 homolog isoform X1 [Monodelphis domestica]
MVLAKTALWVLLLAILGSALGRGGRRRGCNITDVLRHYRAVIFEELQAVKNLPGTRVLRRRGRGRAGGASCRAEKEHRILMSISSIGRALLKAVAETGAGSPHRRRTLEEAVWTVAVDTEAVTRDYCGTLHQVRPRPSLPTQAGPSSFRAEVALTCGCCLVPQRVIWTGVPYGFARGFSREQRCGLHVEQGMRVGRRGAPGSPADPLFVTVPTVSEARSG